MLTQSPMENSTSWPLALEGMGVAGRAREGAALASPHWTVAAKISRRPEACTMSLERALSDPMIRAWAVSLENAAHAPAVRRALEAEKHVLCDYPLALSAGEARELFELAKKKQRILHVEHIGLLSAEHRQLKEQAEAMGELKQGEYLFQGGYKDSMADLSKNGPLPFLALSRLLQVADLFGTLQLEDYRFNTTPPGFSLHLHLRTAGGGKLGFTEERRPGLPRRRSLSATGSQGALQWKAGVGGGGLFAQDLEWFRRRISGQRDCYYDEARMLDLIAMLESIS